MRSALLGEFKARGLDKNCYFHVSDEPHMADLEQYTACKNILGKYLEGYNNYNNEENYMAFLDIGLDDNEIEEFGFGYLIPEEEEE